LATFSAIFVPAGPATNQSVSATTAGTAVKVGFIKFAISVTQNTNIVFYSSAALSPITPSGTVGFLLPANTTTHFDMSNYQDTINFYNLGSSTGIVSIQPISAC
jgi:hypothetical protein